MRKLLLRPVAGILACGLLVGCQSGPVECEFDSGFTVAGTILRVHPQSSHLLDLWVRELVFPESSPHSALTDLILNVHSDTQIYVRESAGLRDGRLRDGSVDDLTVDAVIEARVSTVLKLSDPPQTSAFEIVVDRTQ